MPITYNYEAAHCPPLPVPSGLLDPSVDAPVVSPEFAAAQLVGVWRAAWNELSARLDLAGRWGGGAYAVASGLTLGDGGGLLASVAAGQAVCDGVPTLPSAGSVALADDASGDTRNQVYLYRTADLTKRTDLTLPSDPCVYLGSVTTAGGSVTELDCSGVLVMRGGTLYRRTADAGAPADTPPAGLQFLAETLGGKYWWTGTEYVPVWEPLAMSRDTVPAGEKVIVPATYQARVWGPFTTPGQLIVRGRLKVERW